MRLGISSYTYTWAIGVPGYPPPERPMDALGLVERAARLGVDVVQIADNIPLHALDSAALDRLLERAAALGLAIEVGARGMAPDHLAAYIDIAQRLGSPILRLVVDSDAWQPTPDEVIAGVEAALPALRRARIVLAIENHDRFTTDTLVGIMRAIDDPHLGICLDTVNSFGALEGPRVVVETLAPWVVNLHIKDFAIRRADHKMGFVIEGTPAGQGQLQVPRLLERLAPQRPDMSAILELWTPPAATMAATVAREEAWATKSVAYLCGVIPR